MDTNQTNITPETTSIDAHDLDGDVHENQDNATANTGAGAENARSENAPEAADSAEKDDEVDPAALLEDSHVTVIEDGDRTYHIIGTAHVSEKSRQEVANLIESVHPDKVCIELCQERYDSFKDTDRWKKLDIFDVIRKGKFLFLLANLAISAYQRKMGAKLGVKPGAELIGAAEEAEKRGIPVALIDRNINTTLKRTWANLGFWTKCELLSAIVASTFSNEKESKEETSQAIEDLKQDANLSTMMQAFAEELPQVHKPLIDERDRYLVAKMRSCGGKNVVAVVGAGHVNGMKKYYHEPIDTDELDRRPAPGIVWKLIKWLFPLIVIGGICIGVYNHGVDSLAEMLRAWILPNSVFCFITAVLALAHPLTILAAIIVSPLTSTTPVIGAGIVLGLLEAWLRKPTVADCEDLPNVHTLKDFYRNRFTHVLVVAVLTTIGSAAGAWIGIGWLLILLGVN